MKNLTVYSLIVASVLVFSCTEKDNRDAKPYKFPVATLDSLVEEEEAIMNQTLNAAGKPQIKRYFLADTVSYMLEYNKFNELESVYKFNGKGLMLWQENYYPNGQRMAHYSKNGDNRTGMAYFDGFYEVYYDQGEIKERGMYKNDKMLWMLPFTRDRVAGDTIYYQVVE